MKKLLILIMALLSASNAVGGPGFNTIFPAPGIQKNTGTSPTMTTAMAADVAGAYTGATGCTGAAALLFNAQCAGIPLFANPTVLIGLTANNGTATTTVRSDATHALSQSIAPTWTGVHTFTPSTASNTPILMTPNSSVCGRAGLFNCPNIGSLTSSGAMTIGTNQLDATHWEVIQGNSNTGDAFMEFDTTVQDPFLFLIFENADPGEAGGVTFYNDDLGATSEPGITIGSKANTTCTQLGVAATPAISSTNNFGCFIIDASASWPLLEETDSEFITRFITPTSQYFSIGEYATPLKYIQATTSGSTQVTTTLGSNAGTASLINLQFGSAGPLEINTAPGTSGNVLTSQGSILPPHWVAPSAAGCTGANPTASIGLSAVNGTSTNCIRADGAPLLSQAIAPLWSGTHFFFASTTTVANAVSAGHNGVSIGITPGGSNPDVSLYNVGLGLDQKRWSISDTGNPNTFSIAAMNDAGTISRAAFSSTRSNTSPPALQSIAIGNATDTPPLSMLDSTISMPNISTVTAAQTGTLCWATGGNVTVDATLACTTSSERYKDDVRPLDDGMTEVLKLRPVSFAYKPEYNTFHLGAQVGFIAEEVAKVDPRLVGYDGKGEVRGVRYPQLTPVLVSAVQDLHKQVMRLQVALMLMVLWCAWLTIRSVRRDIPQSLE